MRGGGPAEYEEPGCEEEGADHYWRETGFGNRFVVVSFKLADVEFVVSGMGRNRESERGRTECLLLPQLEYQVG